LFLLYVTILSERVDNEKNHFTEPLVKRRLQLFVPQIVLDRTCALPLHRQIHNQIAQAVRRGTIHYEARLPSTRVMARLLGVSRNTVLAAYEDLAADGLVQGKRGAGMRVGGTASTPVGLRHVIRAARYPVRAVGLADPDGNPLYLSF
jgi:DNA-binding transcriptional regulator YhcF (GntR family)